MSIDRRNFLKTAGIAGAGTLLPLGGLNAGGQTTYKTAACTLIPSETPGPFPLDLTSNTAFFRQDVREDRAGVPLNLKMRIIGSDNCAPMQNVRVNIWHCDKDGLYSGYSQSGNPGQTGLTYLRGYQMTDVSGEVEFITIIPGWYTGRICHIHFQVYVSSAYSAVSQLTFPITEKNIVYYANPTLYTKGQDPLSFATDNIFADGYEYQLATLAQHPDTGEYSSYIEVAVRGSGTLGVGHIEKENAKQFSLGQNYPNPHRGSTTVPFTLKRESDVTIELWELSGRKAATIRRGGLQAGAHTEEINLQSLGLRTGTYLYQLAVTNDSGTYKDCRILTAAR